MDETRCAAIYINSVLSQNRKFVEKNMEIAAGALRKIIADVVSKNRRSGMS